jgi:hypothetical protein
LGTKAYLWPDRLAARQVVADAKGVKEVDRHLDLVDELMRTVKREQVQARGPAADDSWGGLFSRYQGAAASVDGL